MARIPLTINPEYCSTWGFFEGVREIIQNAKDGEEHDGYPMTIEHFPRSSKLVVSNKGVTLDAATLLLLGKTSKSGGTQRGKFGEGFVLGVLALIRAGHAVTIYNGDEVWRPEIGQPDEGHPFEGNDLLTIVTRKLRSAREDFSVEIENVGVEVWEETKKLFLFLSPPPNDEVINVGRDRVLLGAAVKGKVYCRGIYINQSETLECGYDLHDMKLDRDRRLIDDWDLSYALGGLWTEAHKAEPEKVALRVYEMAKANKTEARNLAYRADDRLIRAMRDAFEAEHGEEAVPVRDLTESREMEMLGAKPVHVNNTLHSLLEKSKPIEQTKKALRQTVKTTHAWLDLTPTEQAICRTWVERVVEKYNVVAFADETTVCRPLEDGVLGISREALVGEARKLVQALVTNEASRRGCDVATIWLNLLGVP